MEVSPLKCIGEPKKANQRTWEDVDMFSLKPSGISYEYKDIHTHINE